MDTLKIIPLSSRPWIVLSHARVHGDVDRARLRLARGVRHLLAVGRAAGGAGAPPRRGRAPVFKGALEYYEQPVFKGALP